MKKPELCNIYEQEMLKSNSSVKTKIFETLFLNLYTILGYFILTAWFNSQSLGRPDKRKSE